MIGLRVGPFEIVEPAAVPEPGNWFYARRSGMSQRKPSEVLVRVLAPDAGPDDRAELQRHFDNLRQVEHARVPIAVAMYEGIGAMAITSVRGVPLSEVVTGRGDDSVAMTPPTLLDLLLEVAEILQFAHHRGRPHGTLAPHQLLLAADGTLWVMGFAAGHTAEPDPQWIAPERARGEAITDATDQWSLAALASSLITGRAPWDDAAAAAQADIEPLIEPVERQWPALARLLRKMLDHRPANRYATMHQVRQELLALARRAGGTSARRELAAMLHRGAAPIQSELDDAQASPPTTQLGDTLTPPDATADTAPQVPPPERPTVELDAFAPTVDLPEPPPAPKPAPEPPRARTLDDEDPPSDPIEMARTLDQAPPRDRSHTKLPEEQIPVVRPDLDGEVPDAGRTDTPKPAVRAAPEITAAASTSPTLEPSIIEDDDDGGVLEELTGPTMVSDIHALAAAAGVPLSSLGIDSQADEGLNVSPHPDQGPKSVSDPPSIPEHLPSDQDPLHPDDDEATVVFSAHHMDDEELAYAIANARSDLPASPTLAPDSDADNASEELPSPLPSPVPTHGGPPSAGDPSTGGFLPNNVPASVGHEPELGSLGADVSLRNEPVFGDDDDRRPPPAVPQEQTSSNAQFVAMGGVALLILTFLAWLVTRL